MKSKIDKSKNNMKKIIIIEKIKYSLERDS